ncbi:MAG: hypothetical protein Q9187_001824 [Circinaria calcarea]
MAIHLVEICENAEAAVDIVYVHGLGSPNHWDLERSARTADYDVWDCGLYSRAILDQKPKARRFVWGYASQNTQSFSANAFEDAAVDLLSGLEKLASNVARPLVLVGHSFGGLILKKIFLGTPHAGHAKGWSDKVGSKLHLWPDGYPSEFFQIFADISNAFQGVSSLYKIVYLCQQDWQDCDGAILDQHLHDNCLWSIISQEYKFRAKENHYVLPTSYAKSTLNASVEHFIVLITTAALREQENPKLCLEREQASMQVYRSLRENQTCTWLFARTDYQVWLSVGGPACYWIHGVVGAGKSILCSAIVEDLEKRERQSNKVVSYFYCGKAGGLDCTLDFLKTLAYQLIEHKTHTIPNITLSSILAEIDTNDHPISKIAFKCYLRKVLMGADIGTTFILVVDGLDNEEWIKDILIGEIVQANVWRANPHHIKCCVSSRFSYNTALHPDQVIKISMSNNPGVHSDIFHFAARKLSALPQASLESCLSPSHIAQQLCERANGVFLWLALVIEDLQRVDSFSEIQKIVELLPSTVEGLYERVLGSLPPGDALTAQRILSWVASAYRPLKTSELIEALSAENQDFLAVAQTVPVAKKPLPADFGNEVLRVCGLLICITPEGTLQFRHHSIRSYLLNVNGLNTLKGRTYEPHVLLARTCLSLLSSRNEGNSFLLNSHSRQLSGDEHTSTLVDYAATYWSVHFRLAEPHTQSLNGMLQRFLEVALRRGCEKLLLPRTQLSIRIRQNVLRYCAYFGFKSLVQMYLEMGVDPNCKACDYCETPLHLAVARGHPETVALLLDKGASVYSRTYFGGETSLHYACARGRSGIVRLLLEQGADVNALTYKIGKTPLHIATAHGHLEIMKLLITHNADMNAVIKTTNETPLHLAAANGQLQAVIYLLDGRNASLTEMELYTSIVQQPYYRSWSESLLMDLGINGRFVWEAEARLSAEEDIKNLMTWSRRYADINMCTYDGQTALHHAAMNGHEAVVRILLQSGADLNTERDSQFTALQVAAEHGHLEVVKLLLRSGVNIDAGTKSWGLLLERVADNGHQSIADLLMWQAFSSEIVGAASKWQILRLATKSEQNVVQNALHRQRRVGQKGNDSIKKRTSDLRDKRIASELPLRCRTS